MKKIFIYCIFMFISAIYLFSCGSDSPAPEKKPGLEDAYWPVFRGDRSFSGTAQGSLAESFEIKWIFRSGDALNSSPVIENGRVYIGSMNGKAYAVDIHTGREIWSYDAGAGIEAPPLVHGGNVFFTVLNGDLISLRAETGVLNWSYQTKGKIMGSANVVEPDELNAWIIAGSYDNKLHCVNAADGSSVWTYQTKNFINGAPAVSGDYVYTGGCDALLHQIRWKDGIAENKIDMNAYVAGSPVIAQNQAFAGNYSGQLICVDIETGEVQWIYEDADEGDAFLSSAAVTRDFVVIGSRDYRVHGLDRRTGKRIWVFRTQDETDSSPVICDGKVVTGSADGRLYILNLKDGSLIWEFDTGGMIYSSPAVVKGHIFIGSGNGNLYAFKPVQS